MMVACPNCGAENPLDNVGQEVVCISCFSVWVPEAGSEISAGSTPESSEAEDTYQGQTISLEPKGEDIDPLNIDLGVAEADAEEATAFAMEAVSLPDTPEEEAPAESWPEATVEGAVPPVADPEEPLAEPPAEPPAETRAFDGGTAGEDASTDGFTYTRSSADIIQEESPFEDQEHSFDAMGQTTVAGAVGPDGGTQAFGAPAPEASSSSSAADYDDPFADLEAQAASTSTAYDDPFADADLGSSESAESSLNVEDPFAVDASLGGGAAGGDGLDLSLIHI